ncbi:aerotolerance regulator BatA [bacterium]|nr:MAG: aerotolerance regulator BatA [bacterium]
MPVENEIISSSIEFANYWGFAFLLLIPVGYWIYRKFRRPTMLYTVTRRFQRSQNSSFRVSLWKAVPYIWAMAIFFFSLAAARPQKGQKIEKVYSEGIDIVIALDISSSMYAMDFKPKDRIQAAKIEAAKFIQGRKTDRIGLVVFASKAFPQCPLTVDHNVVLQLLDEVEVGMIEDGTAIGDAIITAANRLKKSEAKSKVIILLTDGRNNRGKIEPITAAQAAAAIGIKIYAIAMGKHGKAPYPQRDRLGNIVGYIQVDIEIDEETLMGVAEATGGEYFRATDTEKLRKIYQQIDAMEKSKVEIKRYKQYAEFFQIPLLLGFIMFIIAIVIEYVIVRPIP